MPHFGSMVYSMGAPLLGQDAPLGGKHFFVRPALGSDGHRGDDIDHPLDTLTKALALVTTGKNDCIHIIADGAATGTVREDAAITIDESALSVIGECSPALYSPRARIAPTTTTVGAAGNLNYVTVSGSGNYFANLQIWAGFATGIANTIALTVSGSRNVFENCHIAGCADAVSAADAGSRSLKITGGENLFRHCVIGVDTVARSAANASVEFASGAARNVFEDCIFPFHTSAATPLGVLTAAAGAMDRQNIFRRCLFLNVGAGTTTMAAIATLAASSGGFLIFDNCSRFGITDWGSAAGSLAQIWVNGPGTGGTAADDVGRGAVAVAS